MRVVARKILLPVIVCLAALIAVYAIFETFGRDKENVDPPNLITPPTESISRGQVLFNAKCSFCHNAYSTETLVGPGLKGILKKERLPVSKRPSTRGNIIRQLKKPLDKMPAFEYLSEEEMSYILAFLHML